MVVRKVVFDFSYYSIVSVLKNYRKMIFLINMKLIVIERKISDSDI